MTENTPKVWSKFFTVGLATTAAIGGMCYLYTLKTATNVDALLEEFCRSVETPKSLLNGVVDSMVEEMRSGLLSNNNSYLQMLPSFVTNLPNGAETGVYYALDLGGTNFRVLRVELGGSEKKIIRADQFTEVPIPPEKKLGTTEELFDFIAEELGIFVSLNGVEDVLGPSGQRELGFTFSFPVNQTAINRGDFIKWTKGFSVSGTDGRDIVEILEEAFLRNDLKIKVNALVNDTVGTLAGAHYWDKDTKVAVILGTGTNACYVEDLENIKKWDGPKIEGQKMVINMEWGNFNSDILPLTFADKELDKDSINQGEQVFEKLISGMYLGEVARRVLLKFAIEGHLFGTKVPQKLKEENSLSTPKLSKIDEDSTSDLHLVDEVLKEQLGIPSTVLHQRKVVQKVCHAVAERGARLSAAGIVGVLKAIGRDGSHLKEICSDPKVHLQEYKTTVAVDGGLYEHYPKFRDHLQSAVSELLGPEASGIVSIQLSKDGSGIGAALIAAAASPVN